MAKSEQAATTEIPDEFAVTVTEFMADIPTSQVEMKTAFARTMRQEKVEGRKMRSEWATLYDLFRKMPTAATWKDWVATNKGGK